MATSAKNAMSSAAAMDLGLGDQLKEQVEDEIAKRRKKQAGAAKVGLMSPASMSLFSEATGLNDGASRG